MIVTAVKCEACDTTHKFADKQDLPLDWIILSLPCEEDQHFCSLECFTKRMKERLQLVAGDPVQSPIESPQSKARRFLLVDGETADEVEGIQWSNGCVTIDPARGALQDLWFYRSWSEFKELHPGDGITWVDQEVNSAAN